MGYRVETDGVKAEAQILGRRPQLAVRLGERVHRVLAASAGEGEFDLTVDGVRYRGWRCASGDEVHVRLNGRTYRVRLERRGADQGGASEQEEVRASMPGVVVAVHCASGAHVEAGEKLLTLESMKLQMTVVASHAATIARLHVAPGAVFERGALLVSFAPRKESES